MKSMFIDILPFVVKMLNGRGSVVGVYCLVSMVKDNPKQFSGC